MDDLIQSYHLRLATSACHRDAEWFRATACLHSDISEVLPYANAELENADYDHDAKTLLWTGNKKKYAFRPREIDVAPVADRREAAALVNGIVATINDIWSRREEITPDFQGKKPPPKTLEIYKLLPRTNCRECGFPSCMAFAAALRTDSTKRSLCPYLSEQCYMDLVAS